MNDYIEPNQATHVRVADADYCWDLDLADDHGNFTEAVWSFDSKDEAMSAAAEFCAHLGVEMLPIREFDGTVEVLVEGDR